MDIFEQGQLKELIEFKWQQFSFKFQLFGFIMHLFYLFTFNRYILQIYLHGRYKSQTENSIYMTLGFIYPWCYEFIQLRRSESFLAYFSEFQNLSDILFVYSGIVNMVL